MVLHCFADNIRGSAKSLRKCETIWLIQCSKDVRKLFVIKMTISFRVLSPHIFNIHVPVGVAVLCAKYDKSHLAYRT